MKLITLPKLINYNPLWIAAVCSALITGLFVSPFLLRSKPSIDLPEEYRLIKPTDNLKGYWEGEVLHIEFNNENNK